MNEQMARIFAGQIATSNPYWRVEDVFKDADSGNWCILLRHRYDTPTQLYVWEKTPETVRHIHEYGVKAMQKLYPSHAG